MSSIKSATVVLLALLATVGTVSAQTREINFDFENTLSGWTATGAAFDSQPVNGAKIRTNQIQPVKLGGDYWRDLPYPLGQHGSYLISTSNAGTGTLTSETFVINPGKLFFSFLIGGSSNAASERVELQVLTADGNYVVAISETAEKGAEDRDLEILQQKVIKLPKSLAGRTAYIKIIDASDTAHINVDHFQFTPEPPVPNREPVWGYGDYHTHPMSHLAFGAERGIHLLWGSPGRDERSYRSNPELIAHDIPHCIKGHGGGPTAEVFINNAEKRAHLRGTLGTLWEWLTGKLTKHPRSGGPEFHDFPSFLSGAHQQMHITQIRRNYDGGLRLLVAIATHNRGAEYLASKVKSDGSIGAPTEDRFVVEAIVCGMKELAAANHEWMEIASSPDDARRIIRHDKLAVVLGVEVDELGNWNGSVTADPADEVRDLWNLGVRVVTPIHAIDNQLGGAAAFIEVYSWLNDFLHRKKYDLSVKELPGVGPTFFELREAGCGAPQSDPREECVPFRFDTMQHRVVIKKIPLLGRGPYPEPVLAPSYEGFEGEKNARGLTDYGRKYIQALMNAGMIIDTAHMSDRSVENVYDEIGSRLQSDHPDCSGFSLYTNVSDPCLRLAYPAIVSHVHFRAEARKRTNKDEVDFLGSEYDVSDANVTAVRRVGGVLGPFVTQDPTEEQIKPAFVNDCAMSSKGFGFSFGYGFKQLGGEGVGMATDFTFIPGVSPRFGKRACWAYRLAADPDDERENHSRFYAKKAQENGVVYAGLKPDKRVRYGNNIPLEPYQMGARKHPFDFNLDGLAHFGLVPDMLQDLKNLGMAEDNFAALFSSAEAYLKMWQKTWDASACGSASNCRFRIGGSPSRVTCDGSHLNPPR
jgi:microsomal dipeptidase-like Zn-dependent dipeptidase